MILVCSEFNDLCRVLQGSDYAFECCPDATSAVEQADDGDCVLLLSDTYPLPSLELDEALLQLARDKRLRLYVEYPNKLPGVELGEPKATEWERVVVSSNFFAPNLPYNSILALHGCWYTQAEADEADMVVARVAGYDTAVYGLPEQRSPILFQLPGQDVLVATSKLSGFVTARYAPAAAWKRVWQGILLWLMRTEDAAELVWEPTVTTTATADEPLPESVEIDAFDSCVDWFDREIVYKIDWKRGALEGFESAIDHNGRQRRRVWVRGDCTGEAGGVFAYDYAVSGNPQSKAIASQIFDYVWSAPDFNQDDPANPVYGLNNWYERGPVFYGDDNARVIMPTLAGAALLGEDRWNERVMRCLLGNLRTTGKLGFRRSRLDYPGSFANGETWQTYFNEEHVHYAPHYQAYLWACFLWAHALTGYDGFLDRTVNAIRMTMEAYPKWKWANGFTQEQARMLLPLAWLVRIDPTAEHRQWLDFMTSELLSNVQPCGAIRERFGDMADGSYPSPRSNEAYGTNEAALIQDDGDPCCDLLYTANFAFLGLHEAAMATEDPALANAAGKLAQFLCRVQVRSDEHPYLDGCWMRGFDYRLWEYYGSSADHGWGAWSVESGWSNAWIAMVLAMRYLGTPLWDLTLSDQLKAITPGLVDEMMGL